MRKIPVAIAEFEGGRRPGAKECGPLLEGGKGKEMDSPRDSAERNATLLAS